MTVLFDKKDSMPYFLVFMPYFAVASSSQNGEFIRTEYSFSGNSKISFMSSGYKPILILKSPVKNFADFCFKFVLLVQNSFE